MKTKSIYLTQQEAASRLNIVLFILISVFAFLPEMAIAAPWDGGANAVLNALNGGILRTIAIIAVIGCGIAALAGKLQWSWAINIIIGIVLVFGAATIVDYFSNAAR